MIISGDYDLLIVPYAVNRQALLDSANIDRGHRVKSLGVEEIHWISSLSNFTYNVAVGIGEDYLALFAIKEEPPALECLITRTSEDIRWNVLVEINSSSCIANGDWEQLESICTYEIPFTLYASLLEVNATNHGTIVATLLIVMLSLLIVVVGCGLYCRNNLKRAKAQIERKLSKLKKSKELKPI